MGIIKTTIILTAIIIIIPLLLITAFYINYLENKNISIKEPDILNKNKITLSPQNSSQNNEKYLFYENIRFPDKLITYSINPECSEIRARDAREAFELIQNNTILEFAEIKKASQIIVSCSEIEKEVKEYFIVGEGGPLTIVNTSKNYIILNGTILLYNDNNCKKPIVVIHEILHVLGFKHSNNQNSIMYNFSKCDQILENEVIKKINELYSKPSLPDLEISNITAKVHSIYLDFEIEITNQGLSQSEDANLSIYSEKEKITEYEFNSIEIGSGKIIKVKNLRIPSSTEKVTFIIDKENKIPETNKENNRATITLNK